MLKEYCDMTFWDIHQDVVDKRTAGTGEIFRTSDEVKEWVETSGSLLWATGGRK